MNKIRVGQTVYVRPLNNAARYDKKIETAVVSKVGNKYFELEDWHRYRFHLDTLFQDGRGYSPDWVVYFSMQKILDEDEKSKLIRIIKDKFDMYREINFTLEQLREINKILEQTSGK